MTTDGAPQGLRPYVVPSLVVHALLPLLFWVVSVAGPDAVGGLFLAIHIGFPVVLLATFRWWRPHWEALVLLVFANHVVSFSVIALLLWLFG